MSAKVPVRSRFEQVAWMLVIWAMSVAALAVVACAFRTLMSLAGLTA